ncbi:ribonuclease catalytic domain-containing protein [Pedosphaera parvula]|uniref:Ribonuclease II n=1 Tax=Pedosphaera parvula (strain Ellin514) TaxID=320771 RepID=B9XGC3_PEDPL|nr:ribonuclease catalytic domain-containing protein [Pedosphaera parvula]EEF60974.1 ribonuclease II [Pedosphaera parvula Ellin514]
MSNPSFDLKARAHQAMIEAGFQPDFTLQIANEIQSLRQTQNQPSVKPLKDLRSLLWSSIDNTESRDLDQIEFAEKLPDGTINLRVAIADVDTSIPRGTATDAHAALNTTSVYTGVRTFPMLPPEFSTDLTSLVGNQDRLSIIIEMHVGASGEVNCYDVYCAQVRNFGKLNYAGVGPWLEGKTPIPKEVADVPGLEQQLKLQFEVSKRLRTLRSQKGALTFGSTEAVPVVKDGAVTDLKVRQHNVAHDIIESFMVAANVAMAQHLKENACMSIQRVVRTPKRWDRIQAIAVQFQVHLPDVPDPKALADFLLDRQAADPDHFQDLSLSIVKLLGPGEYVLEKTGVQQEGHFGLAVNDYTHSTAPNRRFADLVTQRLLKAAAAGHLVLIPKLNCWSLLPLHGTRNAARKWNADAKMSLRTCSVTGSVKPSRAW